VEGGACVGAYIFSHCRQHFCVFALTGELAAQTKKAVIAMDYRSE